MMAVFFQTLAMEGILLVVVILLELVTRRFFCRSFCPLGALLAFLGKGRKLRVSVSRDSCTMCGRCEKACPMGLVPQYGETDTPYCWNCGDCIDACQEGALGFTWKQ